jgi:hypothetical protein
MAGFRRSGPLGIGDDPPAHDPEGGPRGSRNSTWGSLGVPMVSPSARSGAAGRSGAASAGSFTLGAQTYRLLPVGSGAGRDEELVSAGEGEELLRLVAAEPHLAPLLRSVEHAVRGHGGEQALMLLRVRPRFSAVESIAAAPEPAPPPPKQVRQAPRAWFEVEVVDSGGEPLDGCGYQLELPDGRVMKGKLGSSGVLSVHGIDPGSATLTLTES